MTDAAPPKVPTLGERIERLESRFAIQDLAARYSVAVDSKDIDSLVRLYVEDFVITPDQVGRDAVRARFHGLLKTFGRSIHLIVGQTVDFASAEHALGTVYCRAEAERPDGWAVSMIGYFDRYERRDREWLIAARQVRTFYERPLSPPPLERFGMSSDPSERDAHLPYHWPSFGAFPESLEG